MTDMSGLFLALAGAPRFTDPSCVGRHDLFDAEDHDPAQVATAKSICRTCPALTQCRDWLDGLPFRQKPIGVVAGIHRKPRKP